MLDDRHSHARRPARSRRSRQLAPRGRTVRFGLSEAEFAELEDAAARAGMARGAFAAEAALAAARGEITVAADDLLRDLLAELIHAAGLYRRAGVNLNQAVARLHATGQAVRLPWTCTRARPSAGPAPGRGRRADPERAGMTSRQPPAAAVRDADRVPAGRVAPRTARPASGASRRISRAAGVASR